MGPTLAQIGRLSSTVIPGRAAARTIGRNCALENLEVPGSMLRIAPERQHKSRPHPRRDVLLDPGALFRRDRTLVAVTLLQPSPIGRDIGAKILRQADGGSQPQGIAD